MDKFAPFVLWVYGVSAAVLGGYLSYLYVRLRGERREIEREGGEA